MPIPTHKFYSNTYYGVSIQKPDWQRLATRADEQIAWFERVYTVTDPTPDGSGRDKAICAIADQMYTCEVIASSELAVNENGSAGSTSISIGSVSTSSKTPNAVALGIDMTEAGQQKAYYAILQKYLDVYRGVSHGCHY